MPATAERPQHMEALAKGNARRLRRAAIRRQLRHQEIRLRDLDFRDPDLAGMTLGEMVGTLPWKRTSSTGRISKNRGFERRFWNRVDFNPRLRLGDLSPSRRVEFVLEVEEYVPSQREPFG